MEKRVAIETRDLWYRYNGGKWILRGINLSVKEGEAVVIAGPHGSGKTTLLRVITGVAQRIYGGELRGEVIVLGRKDYHRELDAGKNPLELVVLFQNPFLQFIEYTVEDDLYSFAEQIYDSIELVEKVVEHTLSFFGITRLRRRRIFELSGGELRRVAIAKSMIARPKVMLLDEPFLWLDQRGIASVLEVFKKLRRLGITLVISEHRVVPLLSLVDKVYVIRDGRIVLEKDVGELERRRASGIASKYTRITSVAEEGTSHLYPTTCCSAIFLSGVWFRYTPRSRWILRDASLCINRGDRVVILGSNGSGKTTLLKIVLGLLKPNKGVVRVLDRKPSKAVERVYMVPQIPYTTFSLDTVLEEVVEVLKAAGLSDPEERAMHILREYGLEHVAYESPYNISWGQQLVLNIVLSMASRREILLFDEPTTGLSYSDKKLVAETLRKADSTVVVTTHDIDFASLMSPTRVFIIEDGGIREVCSSRFVESARRYAEEEHGIIETVLGGVL